MRVLVVEDEAALSRELTVALRDAGYAVDCATDGARAEFLGHTERYDAVVLDLGLPRIDGLTLLRRWREAGLSVPILVLTARDSWHEKVRGIDSGADDYVAKPFRMEEVLARLRALIRRASGQLQPELRCGGVVLDPRTAKVTLDGAAVRLTSHEYRVLSYLMHHAGRIVSQGELTEHIYAQSFDRGSNTVEVFIARLRRKLGASCIETVRGLGYRLGTGGVSSMVSLRTRILLGAILWTAGLFAVGGVVMTHIMLWHPSTPRAFHAFFMHHITVSLLAIACMVAGFSQVRRGLGAVNQLRERLSAVRKGQEPRVEGTYPTEVQPLIDDLNALLDHREQTVRRALTKAGDLAHGLKTPLSILAQEAERADDAGHHETATAIAREVERMQRQVEYHLAHARAAASGAMPGARCSVRESADALSRTLLRLHADRGLTIDVDVALEQAVRGQREDLDEMLGNLLDNACKWARTRITVTASQANGTIVITVDDDGPGLAPSMREAVLQRGVRADEAAPGSGFGLAIVGDLVELYGGTITLHPSPAGGLQARLELPSC